MRGMHFLTHTFQSTLPARGATGKAGMEDAVNEISIHAPRTGSDVNRFGHSPRINAFQSTLPARGATHAMFLPHTGRHYFNPRSPHGERRPPPKKERRTKTIFQSTLPARGATCCPKSKNLESPDFNPRSPHGERRKLLPNTAYNGHFNPRSPHGERRFHNVNALRLCQFQSTLPARGATTQLLVEKNFIPISIHAPRTGSDRILPALSVPKAEFQSTLPARGATGVPAVAAPLADDFNPRSPHGERHNHCNFWLCRCYFNPRSPHGERRFMTNLISFTRRISIHAPRTGSDSSTAADDAAARFQSTLPARGATQAAILFRLLILISIHAPRTGSDV